MDSHGYVLPKLGRAGLGNELFPYLRALDLSVTTGSTLMPPRWMQLRVGPLIRRERDTRAYWRLFQRPGPGQQMRRAMLEMAVALDSAGLSNPVAKRVTVVGGMADHFDSLAMPGQFYADFLRASARPGVICDRDRAPYLAVHVRLGDFARAQSHQESIDRHNTSTSMDWFTHHVTTFRRKFPDTEVLVASDGQNEELAPLLQIDSVSRTGAANSLDEIFYLANASGLIGSRSTFSAWGAFLGAVPMLVAPGANFYQPHDHVWEAGRHDTSHEWLESVEQRLTSDAADAH